MLREPLDPWQQWLVIHAGELLEDGRPRFRQVLVIVARQNGKTHLCKVLALFWLFVERHPMVFGTSTNLEQAKEAWEAAVTLAQGTAALAERIPARGVRVGNGQQVLSTTDRCRYKIGAADRRGGRGKSIDRAIGDELREQHTWEAYNAATYAMNARPGAQVVYITNMGDSRSVVLNSLLDDAITAIEGDVSRETSGDVSRPVGLFFWGAPPGTHPMDENGWAAANPQLGRRMDYDTIEAPARRVSRPGADPAELAGFQTEIMCMGVDQLDPAIDPVGWSECRNPGALDVESRPALCVDVAPSMLHASIAVAAELPALGRVRVEVTHAWEGPNAVDQLVRELPGIVAAIRPRCVGWFPQGPAAAVDAKLRDRRRDGRRGWPPRGISVAELKAETPAVVMGFAQLVTARGVVHSGQALLDAQTAAAEKAWLPGGRWVIVRRGAGHVDSVYAAAGAVHLARTMPAPRKVSRKAQGA